MFIFGRMVLDTATATDKELAAATFVTLVFTTQKDGVRGEKIGHGATGHPLLFPKKALRRQVDQLKHHGAPADTSYPVLIRLGDVGRT